MASWRDDASEEEIYYDGRCGTNQYLVYDRSQGVTGLDSLAGFCGVEVEDRSVDRSVGSEELTV
jgi:hypothetical protein